MNWTAHVQGKVHGFFMALQEIGGRGGGESNENTCENIVSQYQTFVSSLLRVFVFLRIRPKTEIITGLALQAAK